MSFKQLQSLVENIGPTVRAVKVRNHLVKNFGARPSMGFSDPYSKTQNVKATLPIKHLDAVRKHLTSDGWGEEEKDTNDQKKWYHYRKGLNTVSLTPGDSHVHVDITGPKKSKATTLPYYD